MASDQSRVTQSPPGYSKEYNGGAVIAVATVFIALEVVVVVLRFWSRRIGKIAWGADDALIIPGAIFCLGVIFVGLGEQSPGMNSEAIDKPSPVLTTGTVDLRYGGVGYHSATVAPSKLVFWAKFVLVSAMFVHPAVTFPKLSILLLYLRIFTKRTYRIACWTIAVFTIANCVGSIVAGCLICWPLKFLWDRTIPGGHCIDIMAWYRWSLFMNIVTDVAMLIIPLPVIWKIQNTRKVKIGLTITFATGNIGLITSIIRFAGFFSGDIAEDGTWIASKFYILTIIESNMYLTAACLPTYRPLASLLWSKIPPFSLRSSVGTRQSNIRPGTSEVALETPRKDGFIRLDKSKTPLDPPLKSEEMKPGEVV
ncbi:hypothetical protein MMC07_006440 [Pseudocyphellaria aurata]|nr:hypothetical protein [Pseudocyphellaria aurata]